MKKSFPCLLKYRTLNRSFVLFGCDILLPRSLLADSLGEDAAEERHVEPEVLREGVEAAHGPEVHQTVGRLLAELNRHASWEGQKALASDPFITPFNR